MPVIPGVALYSDSGWDTYFSFTDAFEGADDYSTIRIYDRETGAQLYSVADSLTQRRYISGTTLDSVEITTNKYTVEYTVNGEQYLEYSHTTVASVFLAPARLFGSQNDWVDLQWVDFADEDVVADLAAILAAGSPGYNAGAGDDIVYLPDIADYSSFAWDPSITFSGGTGNDDILGGDGDDILFGGIQSTTESDDDILSGGGGDDYFFSGAGNDKYYGEVGNDTFDFQTNGFTGWADGTEQWVSGGGQSDDPDDHNSGQDLLLLPGAKDEYYFNSSIGYFLEDTTARVNRFEATHDAGGIEKNIVSWDVERVEFENIFGNQVSLVGSDAGIPSQIAELSIQAIEAYDIGTAGNYYYAPGWRGWQAVHAIEMGLQSFDVHGDGGYEFQDGAYQFLSDFDEFQPLLDDHWVSHDASASLLSGVVGGLRTLSVSFKGSDSPFQDPVDWVHDLLQTPGSIYEEYAPLTNHLAEFLVAQPDYFEQIIISGHSLGGALTQHFIDHLVKAGVTQQIRGMTIGSTGGESDTVSNANGRLTNFVHVDDIANLLNVFSDTRAGTTVMINPVSNWLENIEASIGALASKLSLNLVGTSEIGKINPLDAAFDHMTGAYEKSMQALIEAAHDVSSIFYAQSLADTLRNGIVWDGLGGINGQIQIAPGTSANDKIRSRAEDNFVLGGGGNDRIIIARSETEQATSRYIEGGLGSDSLFLFLEFNAVEQTGNYETGITLIYDPFVGSDQTIGTIFGVEVGLFLDGARSFNGSPLNEQDSSSGTAFATLTEPAIFQINSSFDYAMTGDGDQQVIGTEFDDIVYLGEGNKTVTTGGGNDVIVAKSGSGTNANKDVTFDGGEGSDVMVGGASNDTFHVDDLGDVVIADQGGMDKVIASVDFILSEGVEDLEMVGTHIFGGGNQLDNVITGNSAANIIAGERGHDIINGGLGKDNLDGGEGNDILNGGQGGDVLTGGLDQDLFVFDSLMDNSEDEVTDYSADDLLYFGGASSAATVLTSGEDATVNGVSVLGGANGKITVITQASTALLSSPTVGVVQDFIDGTNLGTIGAFNRTVYDANADQSWSTDTYVYTLDGLDYRYLLNDDNSSLLINEDQTNGNGWNQIVTSRNAANEIATVLTTLDDGSYSSVAFDVAIAQLWTQSTSGYTAAAVVSYNDITYDTGARTFTDYDEDTSKPWTTKLSFFNADAQLEAVRNNFDTGLFEVVYNDLTGAIWTTKVDSYDANGLRDYVNFYNDDVTRKTIDFDQGLNQLWSSTEVIYNDASQAVSQITYYDDGTRISKAFDPADDQVWFEVINTYDDNGALDTQIRTNDDWSKVVKDFDQNNEHPSYDIHYWEYDASGSLTSEYFV